MTDFRSAIQGDWRVLVGDQADEQAWMLKIAGDHAHFEGEDGVVTYREGSALAAFPSGNDLEINDGIQPTEENVTAETPSLPVILLHDGKADEFGYIFRADG